MSARHNSAHYASPDVVDKYATARAEGLSDREARAITDHFPESGRVLDLGCGGGRTTVALREAGYDVVAVDVSKPMVRETNAHTDAACAVADASALPFAAETFDCALFSCFGIDELDTPEARTAVFHEVNRVLRPGGTFAYSARNILRQYLPYPVTRKTFRDRLRFWGTNILNGRVGTLYKHDPGVTGNDTVYFETPLAARRRLRATGFTVRAFLGNGGLLSRYLGPTYFAIARAK